MKIACLQMNMQLCCSEDNFRHAAELIEKAMADNPDVLVLPETWNTGFLPRNLLSETSDRDGARVKAEIGALAKQFSVNIVAGSISDLRDSKVYNTAYIFDRTGGCIASYDKTHLFSPMQEDAFYEKGNRPCTFLLDGVKCGIVICYDIRFPELIRSMTVTGVDILFVVSQWPNSRISHLRTLLAARAIENQMFAVCCNSCGTAKTTVYGGNSCIVTPLGETIALAGEQEEIIQADCELSVLTDIRSSIPVFRDRRPDLFKL